MKWKPVVGNNEYEVSDTGEFRKKNGRPLRHWNNGKGYRYVSIVSDGVRKNQYMHRLVLLAFVGPEENRPDVNHKDGDKTNNNLSNLEWCNKFENMRHAYDNKLLVNPNAKFSERDVYIIRKMWSAGITRDKIKEVFEISYAQICRIVNYKNWNE